MARQRIPLFPLHTVLFPGMPLPLHVFEPRYQELVRDCLAADRLFGVCLIRSGPEVGGPAEPHGMGTTCEIVETRSLGEGRLHLTTVGRRRFRIHRLFYERSYLEGEIELLPPDEASPEAAEELQPLVSQVHEATALYIYGLFEVAGEETGRLELRLPDEPAALSWVVASLLQVEAPVRQELLEAEGAQPRLRREVELLRELIEQNAALEEAGERVIRPYRVDRSGLSMN